MIHLINTIISNREVSQNMALAFIIQTVSLIILIIDIVFNHNSYSITFGQRTKKFLNVCSNFLGNRLF